MRLGLVQLLFLLQQFLLLRVFLLQLLSLLLMLLLDLLFFSSIRRLLRQFRVFLVLLLLDSLPVLLLLRVELVLLLLVFPVQLSIRGGLNNVGWWNRKLVRMDYRRRSRAIALPGLSRLLLSRLLPDSFLFGLICGGLLLRG